MSSRQSSGASPLGSVLAVSFLGSLGTSVFWNGLSFIAKHQYGYSERATLLLYFVTGVLYVLVAATSGRITQALGRKLSPRGILMLICGVMGAVCSLVLLESHSAFWIVACVNSVAAALLWPILESFVTAGRHGQAMRSALGWWNLTWTGAVAVALLGMAPLVDAGYSKAAILALCPVYGIAVLTLLGLPRYPAEHGSVRSDSDPRGEYPLLLHCARVLLPTSYLLVGTLSPVMPYLLRKLELDPSQETPMAAIWTLTRIVSIFALWRLAFWHGRWGTLLVGGCALAIGFSVAVLAPSAGVMIAGLAVFGLGSGIVYFAAIYYAMTVGEAEVQAGGTHEALIGMGYAIGPLCAVMGGILASSGPGGFSGDAVTLAIVLGLMAFAVIPAMQPYRRAIHQRRQRSTSSQST